MTKRKIGSVVGLLITLALILSSCEATLYDYQMTDVTGLVFVVTAYDCMAYPAKPDQVGFDVVCNVPNPQHDKKGSIPITYSGIIHVEMLRH